MPGTSVETVASLVRVNGPPVAATVLTGTGTTTLGKAGAASPLPPAGWCLTSVDTPNHPTVHMITTPAVSDHHRRLPDHAANPVPEPRPARTTGCPPPSGEGR